MKNNKKIVSVLSLCFLALSGCCGDKPKEEEKKDDIPNKPVEYFSDVTEFTSPVDMHTDAQKAFVSYNEGYENLTASYITQNFGCDGNKNISAPAGVPISFKHDDEEYVKYYTLEVCKNDKFDNGVLKFKYELPETADGEETEDVVRTITAYNLEIGQKYYYRLGAFDEDDVADYSFTREFTTADIAPRNIKISGITNCRDLGGRTTVDGGRIKQGLLFRTGALKDSQSRCEIDEEGKAVMLNDLKVKTEVELRGGSKGDDGAGGEPGSSITNSLLGDTVAFKYVPFAYGSYGKNLLFRNIEPVRKTFEILGNTSNYPVFFHCRIGTDRTGLIGLLTNALLGVEIQQIFQDYLFSDFGCIGKVPTVGQQNEDSIAGYVRELQEFPGEKLQNKVYNFLLTAGVSKTSLDNMINFLTEPNSVLGNETKKVDVQTVEKMETTLAMTTTDITTDPRNTTRVPANYATFKQSGDKITYNFTADKAFTADLYANLCSKNVSGSLNGAFKVTVNGTEIAVPSTSFATATLGFDKTIECWIPSKLGEVSINQGANSIVIEAKGSTEIKFSQFAFSSMSAPAEIA